MNKDIKCVLLNGAAMSLLFSIDLFTRITFRNTPFCKFLSFWTTYKIWVGFICKNFKHNSAVSKSKNIRTKKIFCFLSVPLQCYYKCYFYLLCPLMIYICCETVADLYEEEQVYYPFCKNAACKKVLPKLLTGHKLCT